MSLANPAHVVLSPIWTCQTGFISDLLLRSGLGDEAAFARLFELVYPVVHGAAAQLTSPPSDESILDAFVCLWRNAPKYQPGDVSAVDWIMRFAGPA